MVASAKQRALPVAPSRPERNFGQRLLNINLFVLILLSSFIIVEPAPYEALFMMLCVVCAVARIRVDTTVIPLFILLLLWNLSGAIALMHVVDEPFVLQFIVISFYLSCTSVVFSCVFAEDSVRRVELMRAGYIWSAVIVTIAGIIGYFHLGGDALSEKLTWAERATGTFKDPNLLGSFLNLPILYLLQRMLVDGVKIRTLLLFLFIMFGLLLSFSRAAWGVMVCTSLLMMLMMWITADSARFRIRIVSFTLLAVLAIAGGLLLLLTFEPIRDMFMTRAKVIQEYDAGPTGRFGRHIVALIIMFDHPKGLGAFEFSKLYGEATHNTFLKSFISYGWLGGLSYLTMVLLTLWFALRSVFRATPWRQLFIPIVAAYLGLTFESFIIDTDHWRHFHLLTGLIWGLAIASDRLRWQSRAARARQVRPAMLPPEMLPVAPCRTSPYSPPRFGA